MKKSWYQMVILILVLLSSAVGQGSYAANADLTEFLRVKKEAEHGDADAQYNLGLMYYNGQGIDQDYREAVKWYQKAAEQGNADAQNNLGLMYNKG